MKSNNTAYFAATLIVGISLMLSGMVLFLIALAGLTQGWIAVGVGIAGLIILYLGAVVLSDF